MINATQAAAQLGIHVSTCLRLCREYGIGQQVGRSMILGEGDIEKLRPFVRPVGNPNFSRDIEKIKTGS